MYLLTQSWAGYAGAFIEDDWERAVDREDDEAELHYATRARNAYERAIRFGTLMLEQRKPGFVTAQKNHDTVAAYLKQFDKGDAEGLLWLGAAWLYRGSVAAERPDVVADLFVGVALVERSVELDDSLAYGLGLATLGAYHARAPDAELGQAKALFEQSLAKSGGKALTTQLLYAQTWACNTRSPQTYQRLLGEVVSAPDDILPAQRLENTIAKVKAKRYLGLARLKPCGFDI